MKIGIITFYYDSVNYGGILQAYALCRAVKNCGIECEQISYELSLDSILHEGSFLRRILRNGKYYSVKFLNLLYFRNRYKKMMNFRNAIPHSSTIYNKNTINECESIYDAFITGSDQVWNTDSYQPAYFLDFVKDKPKIAYAVSLGKKTIQPECFDYFSRISEYKAISVREQDAVSLLSKFTDKGIEYVADPTFLLSESEWANVSSKRLIDKPYIYCHFIGNDRIARDVVKEYAKKHNYILVTIPHPSHINSEDFHFGDKQFVGAGPEDFISLIRNAEIIFTDSFHCCAFATIFRKQFFAFHRLGKKEMASRIISLTSLLDAENHFCDSGDKLNIEYIEAQDMIKYDSNNKLSDLIESSRRFIEKYV